jgi:arylsulfatase A-like enzyme
MTGRNHTTNGMAPITEAASGFPSSNGHIPFECGTIAEVLGERGWNTYMTGKWHLTAEASSTTWPERSSRSSGPARKVGRWLASRTTGRRSSRTLEHDHKRARSRPA